MAWATIYDLHLSAVAERAAKSKNTNKDDATTDSTSGLGCTTYDLTAAAPNKNDLPVGIVIPRGVNNNNSEENLADGSLNVSIDVEEKKMSIWTQLLLSFSVVANFRTICDSGVGSDTIPSIHGLRAISMAWVILGMICGSCLSKGFFRKEKKQ